MPQKKHDKDAMSDSTPAQPRLDWLDPSHYERGSAVSVIEPNSGGAGAVRFQLPQGDTALRINLSENNRFPCIKQRKVADGVILQFGEQGQLKALHLIELKSRLTSGEWRKVKEQLQGALHNAHALLGVLGLDLPPRIVCHTAYKQDAIGSNPALLKAPMGIKASHTDSDWVTGRVMIDPIFPTLDHYKYQRDGHGNASCQIAD